MDKHPSKNTDYEVQVQEGHYANPSYLSPARWSTYARIIEETLRLEPISVLEIGPGPGVVTATLRQMGLSVTTLDFDPAVQPDYLLSATDKDIVSKVSKVDLIIASEVFEHVKYEDFIASCKRLHEVSEFAILTLPDTNEQALTFGFRLRLPSFNRLSCILKFRASHSKHVFDGEHYWEIGKRGYLIGKIRKDIKNSGWEIQDDFINIDNPYHHFLVLKKSS